MRPREYRFYFEGIGEVKVKADKMVLSGERMEYVLSRDDEVIARVQKRAVLMSTVD